MLRQLALLLRSIWGFLFYLGPVDAAQADAWRREDLARLKAAPSIDLRGVGKLLGAGLQHRIYEYAEGGQPMVLKVSVGTRWLRFPTIRETMEDLELINRYFPTYAIQPAEVIPLPLGWHAVKQRRLLDFCVITPSVMSRVDVRAQFEDAVDRNRQMLRDTGHALDFLGREGQRKCRAALIGLHQTPTISNLVIERLSDGMERLRVLDTDLENLHPGSLDLRNLRSRLAGQTAIALNRWLIRRLFQVEV